MKNEVKKPEGPPKKSGPGELSTRELINLKSINKAIKYRQSLSAFESNHLTPEYGREKQFKFKELFSWMLPSRYCDSYKRTI